MKLLRDIIVFLEAFAISKSKVILFAAPFFWLYANWT